MKAIVHYAEIALKGKNKAMFENCLIRNLEKARKRVDLEINNIKKVEKRIVFDVDDIEKARKVLSKVFGVKNFGIGESCGQNIEDIKKVVLDVIKNFKKEKIRVETKRADKEFELKSPEVNREIGKEIEKNGFEVDYKNPSKTVYIEITSKEVYVYAEKINGLGGLPVGSSGKVLALFSGGIDSAVAAWAMMKRGCRVDFLHFHSFKDNKEVLDSKIKNIIKILNNYQGKSRLFLVPYHDYQFMSLDKVDDRLDVVIFKNFMLKFGEKLAKEEGYGSMVTGDSLGQVASQTLMNIAATSYGVEMPILKPLLSFDKQEIIDLAIKIGTYDESIKKYKDCCSIIARKPSTGVKIDKMKEALEKFDIHNVIQKSFKDLGKFDFE